ncbi:glycosyltransferase family 2 protein [Rhizobium sp. BK251]|uniref:glycosyltransferase family 2 protein n=1 Tax=Rhizobium sp. BK251 TaxID=2512125 RepID=UPI00104A74CA|nr:glycosyltransferase family 2 protein [Rhizobium sp. BK251]
MDPVKLSICIPTYNRSAFLRRALEFYQKNIDFPFTYEIVISDNASTDDTRDVVDEFTRGGLPIRYFRRQTNGGIEPNAHSAFRHARGDYAIYTADDDRLIMDGIRSAIAYLEQHPEVSACYAPWYLHNEVEGTDGPTFYRMDENIQFARRNFPGVFALLMARHVFPEIAIYRSSAMRSATIPTRLCYSPFAHLAHFLDLGDVAFLKTPFYRAIIQTIIARDRQQLGHEEVLDSWDKYRGGLEYFLYVAAKRGTIELGGQQGQQYHNQMREFTCARMVVAIRMWLARHDYLRAYELYARVAFNGFGNHPELEPLKGVMRRMVALQTLAWMANAAAGIDRVVLHKMTNVAPLEATLRSLGLREDIMVVSDTEGYTAGEILKAAVLVPGDPDRESYVDRGFIPNLVFREVDLAGWVLV